MLFSKSFGYALRSVLYIAVLQKVKPRVKVDEIAKKLAVPRFFLGKILQKMAMAGIVDSGKGKHGGFSINSTTLQVNLMRLIEITGEKDELDGCVLRFRKCNKSNPCPMHNETEASRKKWDSWLTTTTLGSLLDNAGTDFIDSIAAK